ncbi:MAG: hypothetical protein IJ880_00470 [Bacilli bacterium]|nr:hypothetical protein [Bacilli bacterium]
MIVTEMIRLNNRDFKKTYSDENFYIQKVGTEEIYSEAIDIPTANYEYVETDKKIEDNPENMEETNAQ